MEAELIDSELDDLGNQTSREMNTLILNRFLENEILNECFNPIHIKKKSRLHFWLLWFIPFILIMVFFVGKYSLLGLVLVDIIVVICLDVWLSNKRKNQPNSKYQDLRKYFHSSDRWCALLITLGYNDYTKGMFSIKSVRSHVLSAEGNEAELERLFIAMIEVVYPKWQKAKEDIKISENIVNN